VLNVIIVDDEEFARSSLYFLLQENCENVNVIGIAKSVNDARSLLSQYPVDLIFLDIAMPGGKRI
jgi:two-component system LytT family response regulator